MSRGCKKLFSTEHIAFKMSDILFESKRNTFIAARCSHHGAAETEETPLVHPLLQ